MAVKFRASAKQPVVQRSVPSATSWSFTASFEVDAGEVTPANVRVVVGRVTAGTPANTDDFAAPPSVFALTDADTVSVKWIGPGHYQAGLFWGGLGGPGGAGQRVWAGLIDDTAESPQSLLAAADLGTATA